MARQAILFGFGSPIYVNETGTRQAILPTAYLDETVVVIPPSPPPPPPPPGPPSTSGQGGQVGSGQRRRKKLQDADTLLEDAPRRKIAARGRNELLRRGSESATGEPPAVPVTNVPGTRSGVPQGEVIAGLDNQLAASDALIATADRLIADRMREQELIAEAMAAAQAEEAARIAAEDDEEAMAVILAALQ